MDHRLQEPAARGGVLRAGGDPRPGVPQLRPVHRRQVREVPPSGRPQEGIPQPDLQLPTLSTGE